MNIEDCILNRFQVSGFGCQEGETQDPETSYETTFQKLELVPSWATLPS